jgi:hypothetical protein
MKISTTLSWNLAQMTLENMERTQKCSQVFASLATCKANSFCCLVSCANREAVCVLTYYVESRAYYLLLVFVFPLGFNPFEALENCNCVATDVRRRLAAR